MKRKIVALGAYLFLGISLLSLETHAGNPSGFNFDFKSFNFSDNITSGNQDKKTHAQETKSYVLDDKEHVRLAQKYKKENKPDLAIEHYKKALEINPNNFKTQFDFANYLYINSHFDQAIAAFEKAEQLYPQCAQLYFNRSLCHMQKKETEQTIKYLKRAVEVDPEYEKAYNQLGIILHKNKRDHEAIRYLKKYLEKNPDSFNATLLLGKSTRNIDDLEGAKKLFRKAVEMRPESTMVLVELANTLNMLFETQEALELYKKALEKNPNQPSIIYNYAYTLKKLGYVQESIPVYKQVLKNNPKYAQAHFSLALAYLLLGDFARGWEEYEWRWEAYKEQKKTFDQPVWDGDNIAGQTILLCAEQGLGDTFQFIRYAIILKNMGARVIVQTQRPLTTILKLCPYIDEVIPRGKPLPHFDCYAHLMSLPLILKTRVDTVPDLVPYLYADPKLETYWKEKLSQDKNFKIGICWQGNKGYRTQALKHAVAAKSMHAQLFKPLAELPGVSLYCLQKMNGEEQLKEIDFDIHTFGPDFDKSNGRFMDTAAIIKNLDLVITVDTSICHFAAALGTPVWTILPLPADWRWMLKTDKTPWYPNMKLFRQEQVDGWQDIMQQVVTQLCALLGITNQTTNTQNTREELQEDLPDNNINDTKENTQKDSSGQNFNISFNNTQDMQFQEVLDKLIILKIIYDNTQDSKIEQKLKKIEQQLRNISHLYNTGSESLDELSEKLYDINSQLVAIDQELSEIKVISVFNPAFTALTKRAQYVHNVKQHVKDQISQVVKSQ